MEAILYYGVLIGIPVAIFLPCFIILLLIIKTIFKKK